MDAGNSSEPENPAWRESARATLLGIYAHAHTRLWLESGWHSVACRERAEDLLVRVLDLANFDLRTEVEAARAILEAEEVARRVRKLLDADRKLLDAELT